MNVARLLFLIPLFFGKTLFSSENEIQERQQLLAQAKKYYFQFAYAKSLGVLQTLHQFFEKESLSIRAAPQIYLESWVTAALVHAAQGKRSEAVNDFQKVLRADRSYAPDPKTFAPSIQKIFLQAKQTMEVEMKVEPALPAPPAARPAPRLGRKIPKGLIFGGLGALGAGILAALLTRGDSGGPQVASAPSPSDSPSTGSVAIQFK